MDNLQKDLKKSNLLDFLKEFVMDKKNFSKGQYIFFSGEKIERMGIVLKGSVQIEQNDFWGNHRIIDKITEGGFFAETYAITFEPMMVDVQACENCEIGFINVHEIFSGNDIQTKMKLTQILLKISSQKNLKLSQKIMFTSPKKIRSRLNAFLSCQSKLHASREFDIDFDRQQLADYLNLDRSAMSAELSKMTDEGLIETRKNHFVLKNSIIND